MRLEITHSFDKQQFADLLSAIRGVKSTLLVKVLVEILERINGMALDLTGLKAAAEAVGEKVALVLTDVGQVRVTVDELKALITDPAQQVMIDEIAAKLNRVAGTASEIDSALDEVTGIANDAGTTTDAPTTDNPPVEGEPTV